MVQRVSSFRFVLLIFALLWLSHLSASVYQAQRIADEMRALDSRVAQAERDQAKLERERAAAALIVESRLVRIETQLQQLNDTTGKAVWGAIGTMVLVVLNALLGLVIRRPKD